MIQQRKTEMLFTVWFKQRNPAQLRVMVNVVKLLHGLQYCVVDSVWFVWCVLRPTERQATVQYGHCGEIVAWHAKRTIPGNGATAWCGILWLVW